MAKKGVGVALWVHMPRDQYVQGSDLEPLRFMGHYCSDDHTLQ